MSELNTEIRISAKDLASQAFQDLLKAVDKNSKASAKLTAEAKKLEVSFKQQATASDKLNNTLTKTSQNLTAAAKSAALFVGAAFSVRAVGETIEAYGLYQDKLKLVTNSQAELADVSAKVFRVSQQTSTELISTATAYQRIDKAISQYGGTSEEALRITELQNKALAVSGLTSAESSSAIIQISQAFNKGKLDGDEFRTTMETMPILMDAIAKQLGVTRGELLKLAPEGKITGQVMKDAFLAAGESIDRDFANRTPRVSQAMVQLTNSFSKYVGETDKAAGISAVLGNGIVFVADHVAILSKSMFTLTAAFATQKLFAYGQALTAVVAKGLATVSLTARTAAASTGLVSGAISGLNALVSLNPLTATLTLAAGAFIFFGDQVFDSKQNLKSFDEQVATTSLTFDKAKKSFNDLHKTESEILELEKQLGKATDELGEKAERSIEKRIRGLKELQGNTDRQNQLIAAQLKAETFQLEMSRKAEEAAFRKNLVKDVEGDLVTGKRQNDKTRLKAADEIAQKEIYLVEQQLKAGKKLHEFENDRLTKIAENILKNQEKIEKISELNALYGDLTKSIEKVNAEEQKAVELKANESFSSYLSKLKEEGELLKLSASELKVKNSITKAETDLKLSLNENQKEQITTQIELNEANKRYSEIMEKGRSPVQRLQDDITLLTERMGGATNGTKEQTEALAVLNAELDRYHKKEENRAVKDRRDEIFITPEVQGGFKANVQEQFGKFEGKSLNQANKLSRATRGLGENGDSIDGEKLDVAVDLAERLQELDDIKKEYGELDIENTRRIEALKVEAAEEAAQKIQDIEIRRNAATMNSSAELFGNLATLAEGFKGKQSNVYKGLFAASKAFSIADGAIQMQGAILKALNNPFPANVVFMATVAAQAVRIMQNIKSIQGNGFQAGGFTGNVGTSQIAGVVHGQEFVSHASATRQYRPILEAMNNGTFQSNGSSNTSRGVNVTIINQAGGISHDVQQISENEIRIIARQEASRAVSRDASKAVASSMTNPNSQLSKIMRSEFGISKSL